MYNLNRQVDHSIILAAFTSLVDGLTEEEVWAHHARGRRGTSPRLILKLLAVRFLFGLSSARALGIAELLRAPLCIGNAALPSDGTLDYRLRSGALTLLLERLLTLSVEGVLDEAAALDSTGFQDTRGEARVWSTHGKKNPRGWRKAHLAAGTRSHRVYALTVTPGEQGDATQAVPLLQRTRARTRHVTRVVGDNAYASRGILSEAERLGFQPTMRLREDATLQSQGHPAWPRMVARRREDPEAYARTYHERSNIESVNHALKHRFGSRLRARTPTAQDGELRLKAILHNLGRPPRPF